MTPDATVIDGRALAQGLRDRVREEVAVLQQQTGVRPGLATVLVGDDAPSQIYVRRKREACEEAGMTSFDHAPAADVSARDLAALLGRLNDDPAVHGVLLQLPLPRHLDDAEATALISPEKDVDGLTPISAGRLTQGSPGLVPCTPAGVMEMLRAVETPLEGANAVVIGRSNLVGKPMAALLLAANATVTHCHSRTRDLPAVCRSADVIVAAAGQAELVRGDWVKEGATVIDVGMNRGADGLVGDVEYASAAERARAITPVPGGVGPMTIAMLMANTLAAARRIGA